ncbi:MAG: extracellular solute-binding protein, partial [Spirochaetes bacterium]|nr:extracellular solute-binding protein [Spirochaetota bacterium]
MKNYIKFITLLIIFCVSLISCVKKKQDRIAIRFSTWGGAIEMNVWQATINRFEEKNPDIKITLEMLSGGYQDKLQAMLASETAPDVFYVDHSSMFFRFVSDKVLLNLDPLIKSDKNMDLNDFFPGALDMFRVNGHLYAFPKDLHTFALYYNKDIFDEADLDYPDESWDWNTFIRASKKLTIDKNNDGILDQYGFTWDPRYWMMLVYQNGGRLFNKKKSKCLMS